MDAWLVTLESPYDSYEASEVSGHWARFAKPLKTTKARKQQLLKVLGFRATRRIHIYIYIYIYIAS